MLALPLLRKAQQKHHFPLSLVNKGKSGLSVSPAQVKSVQRDSAHWLQSPETGRILNGNQREVIRQEQWYSQDNRSES